MNEIEKQQKLVDKAELDLKVEQDTYGNLLDKRDEFNRLMEEQIHNIMAKKKELRMHTEHLDKLRLLGEAIDEYSFKCEGCGIIHKESMYCIAQRASGNAITYKCDCGHNNNLEPYKNK